MGLELYNKKRDFSKTAEPEGKLGEAGTHRFLVQKHAATRLHYDFRLELDGVLKSWAVTRGPSLNPDDKRLAVEVEDHPVSYGGFEGTIPKGQYGGGTVMMWDEGTWEPLEDPHKGLKDGNLKFRLHGERLSGDWALVRMKPRPQDKGRNNWLMIKHHDDSARDDDAEKWLDDNAVSITTGRTMDQIAANTHSSWNSRAKDAPATKSTKTTLDFIEPELATLAVALPVGDKWLHEIKFDGYRTQVLIENGGARLMTRTGLDWTHRFRPLPEIFSRLKVDNAIIDGEIVTVNDEGFADFKALQATLSGEADLPLQFYAFDLLHLNGKDLRRQPLTERKTALEALLKDQALDDRVHYSEHFTTGIEKLKNQLCSLKQEGVISKRADAPYRSGRNKSWLKIKCHQRQEFVIGGFTLPKAGAKGIGALLLGYYEDEKLIYAGKVGTGFTDETSIDLRRRLDVALRDSVPFDDIPSEFKRGAKWVEPKLVAEVQFGEWTSDGRLRHPSFQGLREDKPAQDIHRDTAISRTAVKAVEKAPAAEDKPKRTITRSGKATKEIVGGVVISSPDRIVFPDTDITKKDVAAYYEAIADHILPHIAGRPISMIRCPEGIGGDCFFQRHLSNASIPNVKDTGIQVNGKDDDYVMIEDETGLINLMQWGVMEIHPWGCKAKTPDKADRMIFDLDPDPDSPWSHIIEGVAEVRDRMAEFGLESFLKTTGGKGLHVVIPIKPEHDWDAIKAFTRAIAESMAHDTPDRFVAIASKAKRKGKIFVDYLRNDHTATAVAPYSVRARPGAPVAMPIPWSDLSEKLNPAGYTLKKTAAHLKKRKTDPWADMLTSKQALSGKILKALGI